MILTITYIHKFIVHINYILCAWKIYVLLTLFQYSVIVIPTQKPTIMSVPKNEFFEAMVNSTSIEGKNTQICLLIVKIK